MKKITFIAILSFMMLAVVSCSKSDNGTPGDAGKKDVQITLTFTSFDASSNSGDDFTGAVGGILNGSGEYTGWKINGEEQPNQSTITLTKADIKNNVITIETTTSLNKVILDVSGFAIYDPYTLVISTTINNKAQTPVTIQAGDTPFSKDFTY